MICCLLAFPAFAGYRVESIRLHEGVVPQCHVPEGDTSDWQPLTPGSLKEHHRYCLRIRLHLDPAARQTQTPAIKLSLLAAYRLYWNGQWLGDNGRVSDSEAGEVPGVLGSYHLLTAAHPLRESNLLSVDLSTEHLGAELAMPYHQVEFGAYRELMANTFRSSLWPFSLSGALVLIALYFALVYRLDGGRAPHLLFALTCAVCAGLLLAEASKNLFGYRYDWHILRLRAISALTVLLGVLLPLFYAALYRIAWRKWWLPLWAATLGAPLWLLSGYDPANFAALALAVTLTLAINAWAAWRCLPRARLNLAAVAGMTIALLAFPRQFADLGLFVAFLFLIVSMLLAQILDARQQRRRALLAARLESELLRRSLQPHFLMNSLSLVMEWVEREPSLALRFIEALAEEFRLLNRCSSQALVPLAEELALCETHLRIMGFRKGREYRLCCENLDPELRVPPAIIHTLIENAFSHNRLNRDATFRLRLEGIAGGIRFRFEAPHDGGRSRQGAGIGLAYIRARLEENYDKRWRLHESVEDGCWRTDIELPGAA
ncbi:MAG: histidine kinase [Gammaproteobacteria bacterium]|nr:histidine kinase [Gammaproteobacteria bacterium]